MRTGPRQKISRHSRQRERILELLRSTSSHPTADWLYEKLKKEFPRLSLGTVYRNLALLTDQGAVKKIQFGSTFDRFEARVEPHYHLICDNCKNIIDLEMKPLTDLTEKANRLSKDFAIHSHRVDFYGLCAHCLAKGRK